MEKSGASSYIYAKASGMLKKSFIAENSARLFNVQSLSELWELVFKSPVPMVPEVLLANMIEYEAVEKFVSQYSKLLDFYDKPSPFLIELLQEYESLNLKTLLSSISYGEEKCPVYINLGKFSKLNYTAYPNLKKITENSPFSWINQAPSSSERQVIDFKIDLQEFQILYNSLMKLKGDGSEEIKKYFIYEWSVKNLIWALRLKVYYNFSNEKIMENLYYVSENQSKSDPIASFACNILDKRLDIWDDWKNWRFSEYLNPNEDGNVWKINPSWIEQRFRATEYKKALNLFHQYPMTDVTLAMFFCLKKQELNSIRASTEALRLGTEKMEAMYVAGIS